MRRSPSELCRARMNFIKRNLDYVWPALGFLAVLISFWLLYREFQGQQLGPQLFAAFRAIPLTHYALAVLATLLAYAALAYYDRIALLHLGVQIFHGGLSRPAPSPPTPCRIISAPRWFPAPWCAIAAIRRKA